MYKTMLEGRCEGWRFHIPGFKTLELFLNLFHNKFFYIYK